MDFGGMIMGALMEAFNMAIQITVWVIKSLLNAKKWNDQN